MDRRSWGVGLDFRFPTAGRCRVEPTSEPRRDKRRALPSPEELADHSRVSWIVLVHSVFFAGICSRSRRTWRSTVSATGRYVLACLIQRGCSSMIWTSVPRRNGHHARHPDRLRQRESLHIASSARCDLEIDPGTAFHCRLASAANSSRPYAVPLIPQPPSAASVRTTQVRCF
jgi:hypothetical protein